MNTLYVVFGTNITHGRFNKIETGYVDFDEPISTPDAIARLEERIAERFKLDEPVVTISWQRFEDAS